ncbi:hypothetical protein [Chishuiella sp.]|uniref:hypothetical protein n=1 Tax=Chishuiella sp. TaxID=1969467 RepID=UPI0028B17272|nr:hypothetical protein [Chishuiella sp.]
MRQSDITYKVGNLVTLKTHPFTEKCTDIYIQAKAEYTPPILNVFEVLISSEYKEETGEKDIQYQCIYYNTKSGIFEKKWFKHKELKLIKKEEKVIEFSESNLKEWIGKQVILKSVDLELNKRKSNLEIDNTLSQKKNHHLDFLPPLLEVIGIEENEDKKLYSKKTGEQVKPKYYFKVKWYNSIKDKFSEDILPLCVVKEVENHESLLENIKNEEKYKFDIIKITSDKKIDDIIEVKNIYFNTYIYKVEVKSLLTQKVDFIDLKLFKEIEKFESELYSNELLGIHESGYTRLEPQLFSKNELYKIKYKDNFGRITDRIIYLEDIIYFDEQYKQMTVSDFQKKSKEKNKYVCYTYLKAKCFLRNMETRHFQIDSDHILSLKKVCMEI